MMKVSSLSVLVTAFAALVACDKTRSPETPESPTGAAMERPGPYQAGEPAPQEAEQQQTGQRGATRAPDESESATGQGEEQERVPVAGQDEDLGAEFGVVVVDVDRFLLAPIDFIGFGVQGQGTVTKVVSDRSFWLRTEDGGREFLAVVLEDAPEHEMIDINTGQKIDFTGLALGSNAADDLRGTLEEETEEAIRSEPVFLAMFWKDIQVMGQEE